MFVLGTYRSSSALNLFQASYEHIKFNMSRLTSDGHLGQQLSSISAERIKSTASIQQSYSYGLLRKDMHTVLLPPKYTFFFVLLPHVL